MPVLNYDSMTKRVGVKCSGTGLLKRLMHIYATESWQNAKNRFGLKQYLFLKDRCSCHWRLGEKWERRINVVFSIPARHDWSKTDFRANLKDGDNYIFQICFKNIWIFLHAYISHQHTAFKIEAKLAVKYIWWSFWHTRWKWFCSLHHPKRRLY